MWWTKLGVSHRASTLTAQAVTSLTHLANFSRERETDRERGRERERERERKRNGQRTVMRSYVSGVLSELKNVMGGWWSHHTTHNRGGLFLH